MPRGLFFLSGSERCLLSYPDCGLSLAPRNFTKCMDAAVSPLKQKGARILNYFDDWLVLAQSEPELDTHRSLLLSHWECLGIRINLAKSSLSSSRQIAFLGAVFDSAQMHQTNQGGQTHTVLLADPALAPRVDAAASSSPLANSPEEGPPFPGKRNYLTPPTRVVCPPCMAP